MDVVPESKAAEGMAEVIGLFAQYAACKRGKASEQETLKALEAVTDRLRRVVTEMYHLCGCEKERETVRSLKDRLPSACGQYCGLCASPPSVMGAALYCVF